MVGTVEITESPSYEAGIRNFNDGKTLADNPHFPYGRRDHDSKRGDQWDDGWWKAFAERAARKRNDG